MRSLAWMALVACALGGFWRTSLAAPGQATQALGECRLEHPLRLKSVAARCAYLTVAEDPAHPTERAIRLRIAVIPALDRRSQAAPLFLLAGGPGQSAIDLYVSFSGAFARANREHDIVLVDQRGTGRSAPLACDYPDDWRETDDPIAAIREATRACLDKLGDRVRFYTTSIAVQDLDAVRRSLGYDKIDLYAVSYGTRVAELYMRRHAESLSAVVLDGVTYPEQAIGPDTPLDGARALDLIVARCRAAADCSAAYPALEDELKGVIQKYRHEKSALIVSDPLTGQPLEVEFGRSMLSAALRFLSYSAAQASLLPALVHEAAGGSLVPLAAETIMTARQVGDQLASGMQNTVVCSEDVPFFAVSASERSKLAETYQGTEQIDALVEICRLWPKGPVDADLHDELKSAVPTLLLSGEADPVTPPADAQKLARGLANYRHLVVQGEGHGQVATDCVPQLMARFLMSADPKSLDASCLERHHTAPFFVSLTGPAP